MCKSSHEPSGPQRCSGDCRAKAARSGAEVSTLEAQEHALQTRLAERPASVAAWGPHVGPPPFTPPNAPNFDQWYAAQRAQNPDYTREHAYGHFYNLTGNPSDLPGYTEQTPQQAERTAQQEREQRARHDHERDAATLGYASDPPRPTSTRSRRRTTRVGPPRR